MADDADVRLVLAAAAGVLGGVLLGAWLMDSGVREDVKDFWYQVPKEKEKILEAIATVKEAINAAVEANDDKLVGVLTQRLKRLEGAYVAA